MFNVRIELISGEKKTIGCDTLYLAKQIYYYYLPIVDKRGTIVLEEV